MPHDALIATARAMYETYCRRLGGEPHDIGDIWVNGNSIILSGSTAGGTLVTYKWRFEDGGLHITPFGAIVGPM